MSPIDRYICPHGRTLKQDCAECDVVGLREEIGWIWAKLKDARNRLDSIRETHPDLCLADDIASIDRALAGRSEKRDK